MIQPHELMEGNYFQWHELASMGRGVDVITPKNHYTYTYFKDPIPLNKEWLIKFGFKDSLFEEFYDLKIKFLRIVFDGRTMSCELCQRLGYTCGTFQIKYVHQLQNLYKSLTGEQLTIKE